MTTLTIRKIPVPLAKAIRKRALNKGYSLNKATLSILQEAVIGKQKKEPTVYNDLDWFCGSWDKKQVETMRKSLAISRKIDQDLWQ